MQIPQSTHRFHLPWDDLRCDTLAILNMAARRGRRFVDMNACLSADGTSWNLHWPRGPRLNHYDWIWTGKRTLLGRERRRPMTRAELDRKTDEWTDRQIARWRRGRHGGPKPKTVYQRQLQAKRRLVICCWDLKSRDYGQADYAEKFVTAVERSGHPAFYMALVTIANWGPKLRAFKRAGGQTALLAHGAPKPADLADWRPYIDQVWGGWA